MKERNNSLEGFYAEGLVNLREAIALKAQEYIGTPSIRYKGVELGISPRDGFDCSGFVKYVIESIIREQLEIRHCNEFFDDFGVPIHAEKRKYGDLVFFSRKGLRPGHIGIYLGSNHQGIEQFIHAPGQDNTVVQIVPLQASTINSTDPDALYATNPIGFKRPAIRVNGSRWQNVL